MLHCYFFLSQGGKFWPLQNNDTAKSTQDWLRDNSECPKMVLARTQLNISEPKNQSLSNLLELEGQNIPKWNECNAVKSAMCQLKGVNTVFANAVKAAT